MSKAPKKKPGFVSTRDILNRSLPKFGLAEQINFQRIELVWPQIVGEKIADFTKVVRLTGKSLTVNLQNAEWLPALEPLQQDIVLKLNQTLGGELIKEIIFETAASGKRSGRKPKPKA